MAEFSRVRGFIFNGVTIDNYADNDIYLLDVNRNATPALTRYDFIVPKRHGSISYNNRYEDKYIDVVIGIYAKTVQERRQKQRNLLQNFIDVEGKLIFLDEPNLFYIAKVYDEIQVQEGDVFTEIGISFKCSPFMYELYDDLRDYTINQLTMVVDDLGVLVNRAYWDDITSSTIKQIENTGNYEAQPTIEIEGNATLLQMQFGDVQFTFNNLNSETIFIDCEKMIVYKIQDNKKVSALQRFYGIFPVIPVGESDVVINGTNLNLNITVDFKNTYIV